MSEKAPLTTRTINGIECTTFLLNDGRIELRVGGVTYVDLHAHDSVSLLFEVDAAAELGALLTRSVELALLANARNAQPATPEPNA